MKQVDKISVKELEKIANKIYGSFVKGVVDVKQKLLVIDAEMHVDLEQYLLEHGSKQSDLWGINLHPDQAGKAAFVEFDSMINIRPRQKNMSRSVDDKGLQQLIRYIVMEKIHD